MSHRRQRNVTSLSRRHQDQTNIGPDIGERKMTVTELEEGGCYDFVNPMAIYILGK
jgi:hypothetical protein